MFSKTGEFTVSKKQTLIVLAVLYLFTLGIRIYWFSQKNEFHMDEVLNVQLACCNSWDNWNYADNRGYTGKEAKEAVLSCKHAVLSDIYHLWHDSKDWAHTNLYYSLFRISLTGLDSVDLKPIVLRAGILNASLFTLSFIFFFLLVRLLFPEAPLLQLTATFCAFLSTATISSTLFFRAYQMQEASFIVFCYCFFKTLDRDKYIVRNGKARVDVKLLIVSVLATAFALLSGYFSIFFIGLFGLYAIFHKVKTRRGKEIFFYTAVLCIAVLFSQIFYLRYLHGYFSFSAADVASLSPIKQYGTHVFEIINNYSAFLKTIVVSHYLEHFIVTVLAVCLVFVCRRRKFLMQRNALFIFSAALLYFVVILFIAPIKELRYIMPVFPFFILLPSVIIYALGKQKAAVIVMMLFCLLFAGKAFQRSEIVYLISADTYPFRKDPAVPVFIFSKAPWKYSDLVGWFADDQMYYFNNPGAFDLKDQKEAYLVIEKTDGMLNPLTLPQVEVEQLFTSGYFVGVKVRPYSRLRPQSSPAK
ncbi:MAG: hypothetical protein FWF29_07900 [Treponema sp.]|nr:hypothetical protein [Treponema sp.]